MKCTYEARKPSLSCCEVLAKMFHSVFHFWKFSPSDWKYPKFLCALSECILFKCSRSLEGFIASFEKTFSHNRYIGCCWLFGAGINPCFRYSTLYCRHFFFICSASAIFILESGTKNKDFTILQIKDYASRILPKLKKDEHIILASASIPPL